MDLQYFNQPDKAIVGSYFPSENWAKFTQFAVMDEKTLGLLATVGFFQDLTNTRAWGPDDYRYAAECIEQGQLYANAPRLFECVQDLIANPTDPACIAKAHLVLQDITDISEAANRLLGEKAMYVLSAIAKAETGEKDIEALQIKVGMLENGITEQDIADTMPDEPKVR